jgi:adenylate kinase family enzyme
MNERSLVLMGGAPGSGTTRLGRSVERGLLREGISTEHISVGNRIRGIGNGIIQSAFTSAIIDHLNAPNAHARLDNELMHGLISEALCQSGDRQLILLDGYPRSVAQVDHIEELSVKDERPLRGIVVTEVDAETSLARMIKRGQRDRARAMTTTQAVGRFVEHAMIFPQVLATITARGVPIERIDTSGNKEVADQLGIHAVRGFIMAAHGD